MTYFQTGLKVSVFAMALSFGMASAEVVTGSKSTEKQLSNNEKMESIQRGKLATDRKANHVRLTIESETSKGETNAIESLTAAPEKKQRPADRELKSSSLDFSISDAWVDLLYDADFDGYYSEFRVTFDADTNFEYADVFAEMYVSFNGGPWELYHVTKVFEIQGYSYNDDYAVTTFLTSGYPPGSYDVLIDLIDTYDNSLVATLSADQDYDLVALPLEDTTYEDSVNYDSDVSIFDAEIQLLDDMDNDGFYRSYSIRFDADVDRGTTEVFAEIWSRDDSGEWFLEATTEDFYLDGNSTLDTYILETTLQSGYTTGYYDFKIDIFDSVTTQLLTSSDAFDGELSLVPLEDVPSDTVASTPPPVVTSTVVIESGGAGSMFGVIGLLLMTLLFKTLPLTTSRSMRATARDQCPTKSHAYRVAFSY